MRLSDLNWKQPSYVHLSERKEDGHVADYTKPHSFCRLTPEIEPCSPHSPCGALPVKLKPTPCRRVWIRTKTICVKNRYAKPLHHPTVWAAWVIRTLSAGLEDRSATMNAYAAYIAVRMRIELIATDRPPRRIAITPTNLEVCTGIEPVFQEWKSGVLAVRRTDY